MKLSEIRKNGSLIVRGSELFKHLYVAMPRGQSGVKAVWVFKTLQQAQGAVNSPMGERVIDFFSGDYLVPMTTSNGVHILVVISYDDYQTMRAYCEKMHIPAPIPILAVSVTEASAMQAAIIALNKLNLGTMLHVHEMPYLDASVFDLDEDDL